MNKPIIGITMGDAAGIGPEIIVKHFHQNNTQLDYQPLIIGDSSIIKDISESLKAPIKINSINNISELDTESSSIPVLEVSKIDRNDFELGKISKSCGETAYQAIITTIQLCKEKKISAVVTAPINKEALNLAGHRYNGHTELLAEFTNTKEYRMFLSSDNLKVIHVTAHISMREACDKITKERVYKTIKIGYDHLKQLGIKSPRIVVCGLNPHAGENGMFGKEEEKEIKPAVKQAVSEGIPVEGPLPGDAVFPKAYRGGYDLIVGQYHDQGHIPVKMVARDNGVNVTVGLPIIRTSVDHGTAFDIAGKGIADHTNLQCAIDYAMKMVLGN